MDYPQALTYIQRFINYAHIPASRSDAENMRKLSRMVKLLELLGNPQKAYPVVLIAGTKGKGSTASMLSSILNQAGCRTGLYTSPHLVTVRERLRVGGITIPKEMFTSLVSEIKCTIDNWESVDSGGLPSFFEIVTACAFLHFQKEKCDIAVIEVGMGGRFDATNCADPVLSVITKMGLDHTMFLGDTIEKITVEKCGIMRPETPTITIAQSSEALSVINTKSEDLNSPLFRLGKEFSFEEGCFTNNNTSICGIKVPFPGKHQEENAAGAIAAALELKNLLNIPLSDNTIIKGIADTDFRGRIDKVKDTPLTIFDTAHNEDSIRALSETLSEKYPGRPITGIFNISSDKDLKSVVNVFPSNIKNLYTAPTDNPRSYTPENLTAELRKLGIESQPVESVDTALTLADEEAEKHNSIVLVFGSFFLTGLAYRSIGIED